MSEELVNLAESPASGSKVTARRKNVDSAASGLTEEIPRLIESRGSTFSFVTSSRGTSLLLLAVILFGAVYLIQWRSFDVSRSRFKVPGATRSGGDSAFEDVIHDSLENEILKKEVP